MPEVLPGDFEHGIKKPKLLATYKGIGQVMEGGKRISKVRYTLYHRQDVDVINTAGGNSVEVRGLRSIDGRILALEDDTLFFKALENRTRLTLHMEKGQEVDFYIVNAGGQGEFSIAGDGDLHRSSA
jgi:hypothetical protein